MEQANPYVEAGNPGAGRWGDVFDGSVIEQMKSRGANDGRLYCISGDYAGTGIYCNQPLFEQTGITEFPAIRDAVMAAHQTLPDGGIQPFGFHLSTNQLWWWFSNRTW